MKWFLPRNLPKDVDYTRGSPKAWLLNYLRAARPFKHRLGRRLISNLTEAGDHFAVQIKGYEGTLYFPRTVPIGALYVTLPEQLCSWHWHYYQIPQTRLETADTVLDCGSAEGSFPFLNHLRCQRIYAFEPLPDFVSGLKRTFANIPNVEVVPSALGERPSRAYLQGSGMSAEVTSEKTGTEVALESVDHYCAEHDVAISYLKADLEGFEMSMLRGAAETIRAFKPRIAITTYHRKEDPVEITNWLKRIHPAYRLLLKGINRMHGNPVLLHAW